MLRKLFNEPVRVDSGLMRQADQALAQYLTRLRNHDRSGHEADTRIWEIWVQGILTALDELEQSVYCSEQYGTLIKQSFVEKMSPEELLDYRRYLYFYKNSFIRVFSILDKLGYYLNKQLQLKTEQVKSRFSYFTVLRQMREHGVEVALEQQLFDLKTKYKDALNKLRDQRNVEIHTFNYEAMDDLTYARKTELSASTNHIENLTLNRQYLQQGFELACLTVTAIFEKL